MTRYSPSRSYFTASLVAALLGVFSMWFAADWAPAYIAAGLFGLSGIILVLLATRPPIEIREEGLVVGRRQFAWSDIERVDRTGWISPLVVHLTFFGGKRCLLIYPGDLDSANSLLRHLRRFSTRALIDGIPYRQFWGEAVGTTRRLPSPTYRLLREEDEAEVERLYYRLKKVGHLDSTNSNDES